MKIELIPCTDRDEWRHRTEEHPQATVFHRLEWLEMVSRLSRSSLDLFSIRRGSEIVGFVPLFRFNLGPFRIVASPPPESVTPYLGPIVDQRHMVDALVALTDTAKKLKAAHLELRMQEAIPVSLLSTLDLKSEPRSTFVLDLRLGPDKLWQERFTPACRRAIRKAEASGVSVQETDLRSIADRYYELALGVFAKSNRPPPISRDDYLSLAEVIERSGCAKVFAAQHQGLIVAAGIFPYGNGTIYYLDGVSDPLAHEARPNNGLHWQVIRWACASGLCRYDLVGAGIPGVARFKLGFGPEQVPYTYAFRSFSPLARLARSSYARLAPFARALRRPFHRFQR
jgi:CelD/BcsL family acetyltransferase involved in cellulose biosynthesis